MSRTANALAEDVFAVETSESIAVERAKQTMYRKYVQSRVDRALKRTVTPYANTIGTYAVEGSSKFGDYYESYLVTHDDASNTFHCSCHSNQGGAYRSQGRFLCSHAIAVDHFITLHNYTTNMMQTIVTFPHGDEREAFHSTEEIDTVLQRNAMIASLRNRQEASAIEKLENSMPQPIAQPLAQPITPITPFSTSPFALPVDKPDEPPPFSDTVFWGKTPMPSKFKTLRPHQWIAVKEAMAALRDPTVKAVFIDAPTGSGKTLIGECLRRMLGHKSIYLCTTKTLQKQFCEDFDYAALLQGRSNYPTQNYPERFRPGDDDPMSDSITCADCAKQKVIISCEEAGCMNPYCEKDHYRWECPLCADPEMCAYELAKRSALFAPLAVLNTAYFLTEANGPGKFSGFPIIILDEADNIERSLLSYVEIVITPTMRKRLGIGLPAKKTVETSWKEWIDKEVLPAVDKAIGISKEDYIEAKGHARIKVARWQKRLASLKEQLKRCDVTDGSWIYTGYGKDLDPEKTTVVFKPIKVTEFAPELLWSHANKWILMSATFIDPFGMAEDLGLRPDQIRVVRVPNTFPANRRPIYVIPRADMSYKMKAQEMPKMIKAVSDVINAYPGERILVHSVSYELTQAILKGVQSKRLMTYSKAADRDATLERFRQTKGAVLVAPSLDRGVDLPGDDCRVVVIAKIPFPDLSDKQTNARLYSKGGSRWYASETIRTVCQMTGRAIRSKDDYCDIYILDKQFISNLWAKNRRLFPAWWSEAVISSGSPKVSF